MKLGADVTADEVSSDEGEGITGRLCMIVFQAVTQVGELLEQRRICSAALFGLITHLRMHLRPIGKHDVGDSGLTYPSGRLGTHVFVKVHFREGI